MKDDIYYELKILTSTYMAIQKERIALEHRLRRAPIEKIDVLNDIHSTLLDLEKKKITKRIEKILSGLSIYKEWMQYIKGLGPVLAAKVITTFRIDVPYPSCLYSYAGLKPNAVKRRGVKANYNPKAAAVAYLVGESFKKTGGGYKKLYKHFVESVTSKSKRIIKAKDITNYIGWIYNGETITKEKAKRLEKLGDEKIEIERTKIHILKLARRKVSQVFLVHYWTVGRILAGMEITEPYHVKLGHNYVILPVIDAKYRPQWWYKLKKWYESRGIQTYDINTTTDDALREIIMKFAKGAEQ